MTREEAMMFLVQHAIRTFYGYKMPFLAGYSIEFWGTEKECWALQRALGGQVIPMPRGVTAADGRTYWYNWNINWKAAEDLSAELKPQLDRGSIAAQRRATFCV